MQYLKTDCLEHLYALHSEAITLDLSCHQSDIGSAYCDSCQNDTEDKYPQFVDSSPLSKKFQVQEALSFRAGHSHAADRQAGRG